MAFGFGTPRTRGPGSRLSALGLVGLVAALPLLTGCLVDDPPPYRAPQQTAPRINNLRVLPRVDTIITYSFNSTEGIAFSIPIASEDAGEPVQAQLFLDFVNQQSNVKQFEPLAPATLDEGDRIASTVWFPQFSVVSGCHRVIVRVSHESNWRGPAELYDESDVDEVSWFARIFVDAPGVTTLADCPSPSGNPL